MSYTPKQLKALRILSEHGGTRGMRPSQFGRRYFDEPQYEYLFTSLTNTGNGACYGKKAWRAAGCVLGRLKKLGLVKDFKGFYSLTYLGEKVINSGLITVNIIPAVKI